MTPCKVWIKAIVLDIRRENEDGKYAREENESQHHDYKFEGVKFHRREQAPSKSSPCVKNLHGQSNCFPKPDEDGVSNSNPVIILHK